MEREFNLRPQDIAPGDAAAVNAHLNERQEEAEEKIEGEIEKTSEQLLVIDKINQYYKQELEELGLEFIPLSPDRFHLMETEQFKQRLKKGGQRSAALHSPISGAIYVNVDSSKSRLGLYKTMAHEAGHHLSYQVFHADIGNRKIEDQKSGYHGSNLEDNHGHFRGLNEAVLDKVVMEMMNRHRADFTKAINIQENESGEANWYRQYMEILDIIISKISQKKQEPKEEVWKRFKRGFFDGSMMHLRDVERTFGKGSLRVFSNMGHYADQNISEKAETAINLLVKKYFESDDEAEKDKLAKKALNERERLRYAQRKSDGN